MATRVSVVNDKIVVATDDTTHRPRQHKNTSFVDVTLVNSVTRDALTGERTGGSIKATSSIAAQARMTRGIKAKHRRTPRVWDSTRGCWCDADEMRPQFGYKRDKWTRDKNEPIPPKVKYVWG